MGRISTKVAASDPVWTRSLLPSVASSVKQVEELNTHHRKPLASNKNILHPMQHQARKGRKEERG